MNKAPINMDICQHSYCSLCGNSIDRATVLFELTRAQLDVVKLLEQDLTNKEIAAKLNLSERTIKNHCTNIYEIVGVRRVGVGILSAMGQIVLKHRVRSANA